MNDYVKGKQQYTYTHAIQQGFALHRLIDAYTDTHDIIKESKKIFSPTYRLYSGAITDIILDYYLAQVMAKQATLTTHTQWVYGTLQQYKAVYTPQYSKVVNSMQQHDWLSNYQYPWAILKSLQGLQRRATYITEVDTAYNLWLNNMELLSTQFTAYWPQLYNYALQAYSKLTNCA